MRGRTRALVVSAAAMAMFLVAGAAFAAGGGSEDDTIFNYAYDPADQVLLIGMTGWEFSYECTLSEQGTLTATYGFGDGDSILVDTLVDPSSTSVEFADCNLIGMQLTDPSNHGAYLTALHQLLGDMKGWGCVNSVIARSDLGKGGSDDESTSTTIGAETEGATTTTTVPDIGPDGTFDFTTQGVTCSHGKSQDEHGKSGDHGGPGGNHPSHGKSDQAPGHNK